MLILKATIASAALAGLIVAGSNAVVITEWNVPWEDTRPRDPYVDREGRVWFVGQQGNYVAYLNPKNGKFRRYEIEDGTHPHNLVVDAKGAVWYTGNRNGRLVKLDPVSGKLTNYPMPDPSVSDPHTMIFDRAGNAWFTAQQAGVVGRMDGATGKIRLWRTGDGSRPYGIVVDSKQRVWFDLFGTNKIGLIDPKTMEDKEYLLPNPGARPRRIAVTSDDVVWYGDYNRGYLGRLDPSTGKIEEFALPSGAQSLPYAMAVDDRDRVWVAETGVRPNQLVAFDPKAGKFTEIVPTKGGDAANTIRHMVFDGPSRSIWYGTDLNTVGRARLE
jgi:virginiamycin B lyase